MIVSFGMQCGIEGKPCGHGYGPAADQDSLFQGGQTRKGGVRGGLSQGILQFLH
jgi:hypothetical protein